LSLLKVFQLESPSSDKNMKDVSLGANLVGMSLRPPDACLISLLIKKKI